MPTPCVVSGNLEYLSGGQIKQGHATFVLTNLGTGNIPRILGTAIIPWPTYDIFSDDTGLITGNIWGNDQIDPSNTLYSVTFYDNFGNHLGPVLFSIVGASFNLNTATPTNNILPPILTSYGFASGTAVSGANFATSGWGTGATITNIQGYQGRCQVTMTAGTTPSISPTVTLTFPVAYPNAPLSIGIMTDGSGVFTPLRVTTTTTQAIFTYTSLPVATKTYILVLDTLGI